MSINLRINHQAAPNFNGVKIHSYGKNGKSNVQEFKTTPEQEARILDMAKIVKIGTEKDSDTINPVDYLKMIEAMAKKADINFTSRTRGNRQLINIDKKNDLITYYDNKNDTCLQRITVELGDNQI